MDVYERLKELNIVLPEPPAKGGVYSPAKQFGKNLVYISGCGPVINELIQGKLGKDYTVEQGVVFARNCMLNVLSVLQDNIGDLNKVKSVVKVLSFIACTEDFYEQPAVANGGTQLLVDIFGSAAGAPSRSAIGHNALPGNIPVETEAIFELVEEV